MNQESETARTEAVGSSGSGKRDHKTLTIVVSFVVGLVLLIALNMN